MRHSFGVVTGLVLLTGSLLLSAVPARALQDAFSDHRTFAGNCGGSLPALSAEAQDLRVRSDPPGKSVWWHTLKFYVVCCLAVLGLTFAEWRWMIARQDELRAMVKERTRELEAEKAELLKTKAALVQLAARDFLTGIFNRGAIFDLLEQEMMRCRREEYSFAVVLTDLDNFKRINDTYGHLVGDEVLREFARRIIRNLRPYDNVGRFGGEELLVLMPKVLMPNMKDDLGERIRQLHAQVTREPFILGDLELQVTCSFGVAWFATPLDSVESLLRLADQALYAAKANGRNRVEIAESSSIHGDDEEAIAGGVRLLPEGIAQHPES